MILGNPLESMFIVGVFTMLYINEISVKNNGHQIEIKKTTNKHNKHRASHLTHAFAQ